MVKLIRDIASHPGGKQLGPGLVTGDSDGADGYKGGRDVRDHVTDLRRYCQEGHEHG